MRKRSIMGIVSIMGVSSFLLIGCDLNTQEQGMKQTQMIQTEEEQEVIEVDGWVVALDTRGITIDFNGSVKEVHAKIGEKLQKGQPILTLDIESYLSEIWLKENELAMKRIGIDALKQAANPEVATLAQLKKTLSEQDTKAREGTDQELKRLKNTLDQANKTKDIAQKDYELAQELLEIGGVSQKEVEDLERLVQTQIKNIEDIQLQIESLKDKQEVQIDDLNAQIKTLQAQLSNADLNKDTQIATGEKEIESLELIIKQMKEKLNKPYIQGNQIVATEDQMIVSELMAEVGMQIGQGVSPIVKLVASDTLTIELDVPEEYGNDIVIGQEVIVRPIGQEDQVIGGRIISISNQVVESYGENIIKVQLDLDEKKVPLRLGQSVEAEIMKK